MRSPKRGPGQLSRQRRANEARPVYCLVDGDEELGLEDKLALFVLLARLVGFVILPADDLLALSAGDVADDVAASCHAALSGLAGLDVDDRVEQVRFAMLTPKILGDDVSGRGTAAVG